MTQHGQNAATADDMDHLAAAMFEALKNDDCQAAVDVIQQGFDVDRPIVTIGQTFAALHMAAARKRVEICKALLAAGADPNVVNSHGEVPLTSAAIGGSVAICDMLLAAGAEINRQTHEGHTPLHIAVHCLEREALNWLLAHGANPNLLDSKGYTPLHETSCSSTGVLFQKEIAQVLMAHGAQPSFMPENPSQKYLTPFQKAVVDGQMAAIRFYVEECGESIDQKTVAGKRLESLVFNKPEALAYLLSRKSEQAITQSMGDESDADPTVLRKKSSAPAL